MTDHPSLFALDLHALGERPDLSQHVAACEACRAHGQAPIPPLPAGVRERALAPRWRWAWPTLSLALGAAAIVIWAQPPAVTPKTAPAVAVYVKRDATVTQWNGGTLRPGDALQLELASEGYAYEAVVGERVFYRAAAQARPHAASVSLTVDDASGAESVSVVFSRAELDDASLLAAAAAHTRTEKIWVTSLSFAKEIP